MRRSAYAVAIVAVMTLLGGCAASGAPSSTASAPTPEPSTAGPVQTQTTTPTPTVGDDPSGWLITDEAMGPLRLGMPFADALRAVPAAEDACGWAYVDRGATASDGLWITKTDEALSLAQWFGAGGPRTAEGLGVGSTRAEVLAIHPGATTIPQNLNWLQSGNLLFGFREGIVYYGDGKQTDERADGDLVVSVGVSSIGPQYEFCG